ncbi:MAG: DUF349 domain-containing protein [Odoribacteraceae bacterium]|jgi:hypothetical protein|nr:DUF349 domain-containing protein [Odoribacteraceae bacterium]
MDKENLTPSEEPEINTPGEPETSTEETSTESFTEQNEVATVEDEHAEGAPEQTGECLAAEDDATGQDIVTEPDAGESAGNEEAPGVEESESTEEAGTPVETTEVLDEGDEAPVGADETLVGANEALVGANETPVEAAEVSVEAAETPVETAEAPVETAETPVEAAEVQDELPSSPPPSLDFTRLSAEEIITQMKTLIENYPIHQLRMLDSLPAIFESRLQREREVLIAVGEQQDQPGLPDDTKDRFNSIYRLYRDKRVSHNKKSEEEKEEHLKAKLQIIEELKELVQKEESLQKTFLEFRSLQERWRNAGAVPQARFNDIQETYHLHVENFYNHVKINRELRDLDLKKNLDLKIALCEQAEKLIEDNNVGHASKQLQHLYAQWREIGPVPREQKDSIWERFREANAKVNEAYCRFFDNLREEQENNMKVKDDLCCRMEELAALSPNTLAEWNGITQQILDLQEEWKRSGIAPLRERNKIYRRFRNACDIFFNNKRAFYKTVQAEQSANVALKVELCEKVEAIQNDTEWRATSDKIIAYQREWKTIGPVSKKVSDKLWTRFRTACDVFFNNKAAHTKGVGTDQQQNLELKKALIEELRAYTLSDDNDENIRALKDFQTRWMEIGYVPIKEKAAVQTEFRTLINETFDRLDIPEFDRDIERFRSKMDTFDGRNDSKDVKIVQEREKLVSKIRQLESDLHAWENNIGFFSKTKSSEELINEFTAKIADARQKLALMQEKLKVIDNMI